MTATMGRFAAARCCPCAVTCEREAACSGLCPTRCRPLAGATLKTASLADLEAATDIPPVTERPTPRTDAAIIPGEHDDLGLIECVPAKLARELERELDAASKLANIWQSAFAESADIPPVVSRQPDVLRAWHAAIDEFREAFSHAADYDDQHGGAWIINDSAYQAACAKLDAAYNAAIAADKQPPVSKANIDDLYGWLSDKFEFEHPFCVTMRRMEKIAVLESNVPCHGPWGDLIADAYWFADSYVCGLIDSESTYEDDGWRQMDPDDLHSEWHYAERRGLIEHDPGHRGRFRFTPGREFLGPGVAPNNGGAARPVSREGVAEETPKRIDADSRTEIGDLGDKAESEARAQTRSATSEKGGTDHLGQPSGANTSIVERVANPVAPTLQAAIDELLMGVPTPGMESGGPRNWIVDAVGVLRAARKRLELDGTPYDGIATRDETIRLQDERIKALESPPVGRSPQNGNPMNLTIWTGIREYIAAEIALADARRELNEASTDEEIGDRAAVVRRLEEQSTRMETSVRESL